MYKKGCITYYEIGDKVGPYQIEILSKLYQDKSKKWHYEFKCPFCSNSFDSVIGNVHSGATRSCGCYKHNAFKKNLVGQKFGRLTVLEETNKRSTNRSIIWKCKCDCGNIIELSTNVLTSGNTQSCGCLHSKGEAKIQQLLDNMNIKYIHDKQIFKDCRNPNTNKILRFDFYLPNYNCCIEYDGEQHDENFRYGSWRLDDLSLRDKAKDEYCLNNNIKLIRISYQDFNKITETYLKEKIYGE